MEVAAVAVIDVLIVSPFVPFDGVPHAGGVFLYHHLEGLSSFARLTLLTPRDALNERAAGLAPPWLKIVLAPQSAPTPGSARHLRDRVHYQLRGRSPFPHVRQAIVNAGLIARARRADLVELHWPEYAHFAPLLRRAGLRTPIVIVDHDVASDIDLGSVRLTRSRLGRTRVLALRSLHRSLERRAHVAADLVLVFKATDESLLRRMGVRTAVRVMDPWLDGPTALCPDRDGLTVLFTAAFGRQENDSSARWLLSEVWTAVVAAVPQSQLVLAGAGPTRALRAQAAAYPNVVVTGEVPDLEPYYMAASVFVAPLHVAGGLKFKVPQAMIYGLPVVATNVAAAGVVDAAPPGTFWAVTDEPTAFAREVVRALQNTQHAAAVGQRAASWVCEHYSFKRSSQRLAEDYRRLTAGRAQLR